MNYINSYHRTVNHYLYHASSVYSAGCNDEGELARSGKRSIFMRIDAIESFSVTDIAAGEGYCMCILRDGKVLGWGRNELGQLGCGDREPKRMPRPISFSEVFTTFLSTI